MHRFVPGCSVRKTLNSQNKATAADPDPPDDSRIDHAARLLGAAAAIRAEIGTPQAIPERNATEHGRALHDELALLVVHGTLHVLGMDHADDEEAAVMQARVMLFAEQEPRQQA